MSEALGKSEYSSNYSSLDDSGDDTDADREPIQLFNLKCDNWNDVYAVIQSEQPELLEKFLFLYRRHVKWLSLTGLS